jgi:Putative zinc-finger
MAKSDCIADEDLQAFLLGELPERRSSAIARHLELCPACEGQAGRWDDLCDSAIRALRQAAAEPAVAVCLSRLAFGPETLDWFGGFDLTQNTLIALLTVFQHPLWNSTRSQALVWARPSAKLCFAAFVVPNRRLGTKGNEGASAVGSLEERVHALP